MGQALGDVLLAEGRFGGKADRQKCLSYLSAYTVRMSRRQAKKQAAPSRGRRVVPRAVPEPLAGGWRAQRFGGMTVLRAAALERLPWLVHGFSTRPGGESRLGAENVLNLGATEWDTAEAVAANRAAFLRAVLTAGSRAADGSVADRLVTLRQCHSDFIHAVNAVPERMTAGDGLLTQTAGLLLAVRTADCLPILIADTRHRAVAAVHAGWRGTLARVAEKALGRMRMQFGTRPEDVVVVLGPAIGGCCYEVGPEVVQAFAARFAAAEEWFEGPFTRLAANDDPAPFPWLSMTPPGHEAPPARARLDLRAANRWQLAAAGVPAEQIVSSELCTGCRTDLLFSHRRERGRTGRLLAVIGISGDA